MVVLKAVAIFAFVLLTTMFMLWAERRLLGQMQNRPGPQPRRAIRATPVVRRNRKS
jgi:NADH:ubiquinone oxidoreductase subunit H